MIQPSVRKLPLSQINFNVCLAPMVGLSNVALRLLVRRYTPSGIRTIWPTEMLNSRRLPNEDFKKTPEVFRSETEADIVPQILGNEELAIQKSITRLKEWGAVGVDINMGCPVQKALKHNYGVALMGDPDYAARVVEMAVKSSDLPVSVKLRAGLEQSNDKLVEFVKKIESAGASWITLHPRFANQKRRGVADWSRIRDIRSEVKLPVIGNGDVQVVEDIDELLQVSGCDMVMIGRALTARPWLMWQYGEKLGLSAPESFTGLAPKTAEEEGQEYESAIMYLIGVMREYFEEGYGLRKLKFFVRTSSPWLEYGNTYSGLMSRAGTYDEAENYTKQFFSQPQRMLKKTDLRI